MGVEVAEIPSHYLSDSEKQVNERQDNGRFPSKKGRPLNKHDRRGRFNKNDRFVKQKTLENKDSSNIFSLNQKKPTLLQKLLSADIRRDKHHLLQVFRLMAINSFFEDWPEKPLRFPLVVVKEDGRVDNQLVAENSSCTGKDVDGDKQDEKVEQGKCYAGGKCSLVQEIDRTEGEEGEIID